MTAKDELEFPSASALAAYRVSRRGRGNAVTDTTQALREAILDGVLEPDEWLREESLTEILGVSRTPVREALNRLEEEGLIQRKPGQGARVTSLSIEDMSVVYQVRGSLESLTARMATERGTLSAKATLKGLHQDMQQAAKNDHLSEFSRLNIAFHAELAEMAGNAYLSRMLGTVETAIRRFGTRSYNQDRMRHIILEHAAILESVLSGDGDSAAQAAIAHADHARTATLNRFFESI